MVSVKCQPATSWQTLGADGLTSSHNVLSYDYSQVPTQLQAAEKTVMLYTSEHMLSINRGPVVVSEAGLPQENLLCGLG